MDVQAWLGWAGVAVGAGGVAAAFYTSTKALRHSVKMSEHELRAYVFLKEAKMEMAKLVGGRAMPDRMVPTYRVTYQYQNTGKTPAKDVKVAVRALWVQTGTSLDSTDMGPFRPIGPVGPSDEFNDAIDIDSLPPLADLRSTIEKGEAEVHLIGRIQYSDEWSDQRETSFHYYVGADAGWDEEMTAAITGNDYR